MIKRIIDISNPAYLHIKQNQLLIDQDNKTIDQIPVEDLGIVILQHPAIVITQAVVIACQENNTALVFCDARRLPYAITLPVSEGHSLHSRILKDQLALTLPAKKRLWQQIVKHKIRQQSKTLKLFGKDFSQLDLMVKKVKSGDRENYEAKAAQKYWRLLFGNKFRRNTDAEGINTLLNYGYAVERAMVARAIVGGGMHPALGLHHHNQYNGLNLADDLMEPFRPWVDRMVFELAGQGKTEINQDTKKVLLSLPSKSVRWRDTSMPLMVYCHHLTANLKRAGKNKSKKLVYPDLEDVC